VRDRCGGYCAFLNTAGQHSPVPDSEEIKKDRAVIVYFKWPLFNGGLNVHVQCFCYKKMVSEVGNIWNLLDTIDMSAAGEKRWLEWLVFLSGQLWQRKI